MTGSLLAAVPGDQEDEMRSGNTALVLLLMLGISITPAWAAQGRCDRGPGMRRLPVEKLAERLQLTDEEATQLKAIDRERMSRQAELEARVSVLRYDLQELMAADTIDESAVYAQLDAIGVVRTEMAKAQFSARIQLKTLLGDRAEELERLASRRDRRAARQARRASRRGRDAPALDSPPAPLDDSSRAR